MSARIQATTRYEPNPTSAVEGRSPLVFDKALLKRYDETIDGDKIAWTGHFPLIRLLGRGGQGEVFLSQYRGTDGFTIPVAMKVFSPERYATAPLYTQGMHRVASMAARIAQIQHDNLLDVQNFIERRGIRILVMEWIDGYDLGRLVAPERLSMLESRVSAGRWRYINEVIVTEGMVQSRFKAGVAVAIARECLAGLAALHRDGILHGDIKPSNIMLKRSGHAKLIDVGSAFDVDDPPPIRDCTPTYAAPEVLEQHPSTFRSDLASLGYVLIELLSGRPPFQSGESIADLLAAKRALPSLLNEILPDEVQRNTLLMSFIHGLIAPDPNRRFPSAEAAEHVEQGAAAFHRQLVLSDMATEYDNDIRVWLNELRQAEDDIQTDES